MGKTIRVTDQVYERLQLLQRIRETYSEVIERTLEAYDTIQGIREGLPPSHYLQERPKQEVKQ